MLYEHLKHSGELPIIGVNTFVNAATLAEGYVPPKIELARASYEEKNLQLNRVHDYQKTHQADATVALRELREQALSGGNIFAGLMKAARHCSLY